MLREDMVWTEGIETFFKEQAPKAGLEIAGISVVPVDVEDLTPYFRSAEQAGAADDHDVHLGLRREAGQPGVGEQGPDRHPRAQRHPERLRLLGAEQRAPGARWRRRRPGGASRSRRRLARFRHASGSRRTRTIPGRRCGSASAPGARSSPTRKRPSGPTPSRLAAVIPELEKTYYPDAPTRGGFYGDGQGDWPHAWCSPIDATASATADPPSAVPGLWESSPSSR